MMAVAYVCDSCQGMLGMEPQHCHGSSDRVQEGVLGGYRCSCRCTWESEKPAAPSPMTLWNQANERYPNNPEARRLLYNVLMRQHGHVIDREPGDTL